VSERVERDGEASAEAVKHSLRTAIEKMTVPEITALIEFAEQTQRHKQEAAREELLTEFRKRASDLGLSLEGLVASKPASGSAKTASSGKKVPAKYRGPNGEEWTGRGRTPSWLKALEAEGKNRDQFSV